MLPSKPKSGPRSFAFLRTDELLHPHDLVTVCAALATHLDEGTPQEADWHQRLADALFQHFGLSDLPQAHAAASVASGTELRQALGDRDVRPLATGFELANAWGFPVEQLDSSVTTGALEAKGLALPSPRDEDF
ncbi:hypothetical protein [Corallococcus carmarthensis]|uniref:hypothetical protein n=1 Tax=Corallococcus carmarthensis TaxID=2316728 RepID=UPI0011C476AB|nr:hypothetical protein [Corallococcus carmarthensis]NOK19002.1 hypothetical protein [Corallococcus carmarthensis]